MLSIHWRQSLFFQPLSGPLFLSAPHHIVFAFRRYTELFVFTSNTSMYTSFLQFQLCHRFYVHYVVSFSFYFFFVAYIMSSSKFFHPSRLFLFYLCCSVYSVCLSIVICYLSNTSHSKFDTLTQNITSPILPSINPHARCVFAS